MWRAWGGFHKLIRVGSHRPSACTCISITNSQLHHHRRPTSSCITRIAATAITSFVDLLFQYRSNPRLVDWIARMSVHVKAKSWPFFPASMHACMLCYVNVMVACVWSLTFTNQHRLYVSVDKPQCCVNWNKECEQVEFKIIHVHACQIKSNQIRSDQIT